MPKDDERAWEPSGERRTPAPEDVEREAAWRRGEARERARAAGEEPPRGAHTGHARAGVAARAFAALAENVREYAIFLMDPAGVITFWGEGARFIKWWTKVQAERHGAQRARLGWSEQELHREFTILREELTAAVRRRGPVDVPGPTSAARRGEAERVLEVLHEFVAVAERLSVASFRRAAGAADHARPSDAPSP
jgi:hypothetical protein